jgi:hypothetical protein
MAVGVSVEVLEKRPTARFREQGPNAKGWSPHQMTKHRSNNSDDPRQPGMIEPDPDNADPWADPDNDDPWSAGYAAGLRASGSTHISDDNVDPRVVVVRMLPDEYLDEAIAKSELIELRERVIELGRRVARVERDYPPRLH